MVKRIHGLERCCLLEFARYWLKSTKCEAIPFLNSLSAVATEIVFVLYNSAAKLIQKGLLRMTSQLFPTFEEMLHPDTVAPEIRAKAQHMRTQDPLDPVNLFNINWYRPIIEDEGRQT